PADRLEHTFLPRPSTGHVGPAAQTDDAGLHRLPDVDIRMSEYQDVLRGTRKPGYLAGDRRLLGAVDEMVQQHAQPPTRLGRELGDDGGQVIGAAQLLDNHALEAQVVAPHLLDQFGVVAAFDVDPAGTGHAGTCVRY